MADKTKHVGIIMSLVARVHDALRASDNAVVGNKAYADISKMMFLQFIHPYIKPGASLHTLVNSEAYKINDEYPENFDKIYLKYMDIDELLLLPFGDGSFENTLMRIWDLFKIHPVTKIIFQDGNFFKAPIECIRECLFDINKVMESIKFDQLDTDIKGVIYEHFVNGYADKGGKEFGQFFTPRAMVNLILDMNNKYFPDMKVETIYDPCMGTAGFLTEMYKLHRDTIKPENIYGGEIEPDTYSSALTNLLLTTGTVCNVIKCNSFYNNKNIKFDWICTNPPFGIDAKYDKIISKPMYTDEPVRLVKKQHRLCTSASIQVTDEKKAIPMEELYPFETNDATALFLQHCMYKLAYKGVCCIVLPDGQHITSKSYIVLRKTLVTKFNIKTIISVPKGTFKHACVRTTVLIFTNDDTPTTSIDFYETTQDCITCTLIKAVSIDEIKENSYSLYYRTYVQQEIKNFGELFDNKTIGDVCVLTKGRHATKKTKTNQDGISKFITVAQEQKWNNCDFDDFDEAAVFVSNVSGGNTWPIHYFNGKFAYCDILFKLDIVDKEIIIPQYLYYYLIINVQKDMYKKYIKGGSNDSLDRNEFNKLQIPVPSLKLQKEIVYDCDTFKSLKKLYMKTKILLLKKIKVYKKIHIDVLSETSDAYLLGDVCSIIIGFTPSTKKPEFYTNGSIKWACISDMKDRYITDTANKITSLAIIGKAGKLHKAGTVLLSFKLSMGKVSFAACDLYTNEAIAGINSINENLLNEYIAYYLSSRDITHDATGMIGNGSLNKEKLKILQIPIPSLEKQKEIISVFKELYDEIDTLDKKIKQYDDNIKLVFGKYSLVNSTATENTMESAEAD